MTAPPAFRLKVQKLDPICLFELSWGQGQQLTATLSYPIGLTKLYQDWQRCYLSFYKTAQMPLSSTSNSEAELPMRGWAIAGGNSVNAPVDWQAHLAEAEVKLLNEFHRWLQSGELFELRAVIARASRSAAEANRSGVDVFLVCAPIELARLPWEAWEISSDFAVTGTTRIVRSPLNIRAEITPQRRQRHRRTRILAIMGDDTGLNFQADREAVRALSRMAEVKFVGWQPGQTALRVKDQIRQELADEEGWDVLFFAGHSNETKVTGGELMIAPAVSLSIQEIAPQLTVAKQRGLQFAIFNSCSGLNIAESLINLGFSQVAVMREPIHNRVAQEFLVQFLRELANHHNVHESLLAASQFLHSEKSLTYPSAYLVPSLFCHPGATLFQIPASGWKQHLRKFAPLRLEMIALTAFLVLGLIPPVQDFLLDRRILLQAMYRHATAQIPAPAPPPVVLVQIDKASINHDQRIVNEPAPIGRSYLADLIDRLSERQAKVIGIDYLLDYRVTGTEKLRQSLESSVRNHQTWFVFAALPEDESENVFITEQSQTADRAWSLQAQIFYWVTLYPSYVALPRANQGCRQDCPFAYLLSLVNLANHDLADRLPQPSLNNSNADLRTEFLNAVDREAAFQENLSVLQQSQLSPLSAWVDQHLNLIWWQPLIDFSIPADRAYTRVPAWRVLEDSSLKLPLLSQQIVIIGAGDYEDADGAVEGHIDLYPVPAAMQYWNENSPSDSNQLTLRRFSGAEAHAYMIHHLLNQRLVMPIPHLWMVGLTGVLSRSIVLGVRHRQQQCKWTRKRRIRYIVAFASSTVLYGLVSLQLYLIPGLLLPWLLPSAMFWIYILPTLRRKIDA